MLTEPVGIGRAEDENLDLINVAGARSRRWVAHPSNELAPTPGARKSWSFSLSVDLRENRLGGSHGVQ